MGIFSFFKRDKEIIDKDLPWYNLPSIYGHIAANIDHHGKLTEDAVHLPDEERRYKKEKIRWVPGAMNGVYSHHFGVANDAKIANKVANLIIKISNNNSLANKVDLYKILVEDNLMNIMDPALEKIARSNISIDHYLHEYAKWLAFESPDRGPV